MRGLSTILPPRRSAGAQGPSVIFPAIYAVIIWYLAMRWRRQWPGYGVVAAGFLSLLALDLAMRRWNHGAAEHPGGLVIGYELLAILLRPYAVLLGVVGLFIVCLPRVPPTEAHCRKCHYDLTGLDPRALICPECGVAQHYRCSVCEHEFKDASPADLKCPECGTRWAGAGAVSGSGPARRAES